MLAVKRLTNKTGEPSLWLVPTPWDEQREMTRSEVVRIEEVYSEHYAAGNVLHDRSAHWRRVLAAIDACEASE
jgi:hypothetical protein